MQLPQEFIQVIGNTIKRQEDEIALPINGDHNNDDDDDDDADI